MTSNDGSVTLVVSVVSVLVAVCEGLLDIVSDWNIFVLSVMDLIVTLDWDLLLSSVVLITIDSPWYLLRDSVWNLFGDSVWNLFGDSVCLITVDSLGNLFDFIIGVCVQITRVTG